MALATIIPSTPGIEVLINGVWQKLDIKESSPFMHPRKVYKSIQETAHAPLGELELLKRTITTRYSEGDVVED